MAVADMATRIARLANPPAWAVPVNDPDVCQECQNTGWSYTDSGDVTRCQSCLSRKLGKAPGIPEDEYGTTLANFKSTKDNQDAIQEAKRFVDGVHPNLYMFGGVGTGKTRLACSILNELHAQRERVEFYRVSRLIGTTLPGAEDIDAIIERIASVPVVCLDDVGLNQATDFSRRTLLLIYEARTDRRHRTIWTSNLDLAELAELNQDERLASRIAGSAKVVELKGHDWRLARKR